MIRKLFLLAIFLFVSASLRGETASGQSSPEEVVAKLSTLDTEGRRVTMRDFAKRLSRSLSRRDFAVFSDALLPVFEMGMNDSDEEVRRQTAGALNLVSRVVFMAKREEGRGIANNPIDLDLSKSEPLKQSLLKACAEDNPEIRKFSIAALGLAFSPSEKVEAMFNQKFATEKDYGIRRSVLMALVKGNYTSTQTARNFLILFDDSSSEFRGYAADYFSKSPNPEALPKIVKGIREEEGVRKHKFINAVSAFGGAARPHLSMLKELKSSTTEQATVELLRGAIKMIEEK